MNGCTNKDVGIVYQRMTIKDKMEVYKKYKPRPEDGPNVMAGPVTFLPLPTTVRSLYGRFVLRDDGRFVLRDVWVRPSDTPKRVKPPKR